MSTHNSEKCHKMTYLDALRLAHDILDPRFYIEIGCRYGNSLSLAKCPSLAIDPKPQITFPLHAPTRVYRETSDDFFARDNLDEIISNPPDLAFIDGMHLVEFALRDFMNLENHAAERSVIMIDDIVPDDITWASRERKEAAWTGDVYQLISILRTFRPDLDISVFDVETKGMGVISNLDPGNRTLPVAYGDIMIDIADGRYVLDTTEALRSALKPQSTGLLNQCLQDIRRRHSPAS